MAALAYLLTFRSYGTWCPGDARGSNARRSPLAPGDSMVHRSSTAAMVAPPFLLNGRSRALTEAAIREHCAHAGWTLHAVHVRSNHVHVVVSGTAPPERMMVQLKAWATRRLRNEGASEGALRVWAQHGSTRYLWTWEAIEAACRYVVEGQGAPLASE